MVGPAALALALSAVAEPHRAAARALVQGMTVEPCRPNLQNQSWSFAGGALRLASSPALCATYGGDGVPLVMDPCNASTYSSPMCIAPRAVRLCLCRCLCLCVAYTVHIDSPLEQAAQRSVGPGSRLTAPSSWRIRLTAARRHVRTSVAQLATEACQGTSADTFPATTAQAYPRAMRAGRGAQVGASPQLALASGRAGASQGLGRFRRRLRRRHHHRIYSPDSTFGRFPEGKSVPRAHLSRSHRASLCATPAVPLWHGRQRRATAR